MSKRARCRSRSLVAAAKKRAVTAAAAAAGGAKIDHDASSFANSAAAAFQSYYLKQEIVDGSSWDEFWRTLQTPLPITFRFNSSSHAAASVEEAKAEGAPLLSPREPLHDDYGNEVPASLRLPWVDGWQLHVERTALRRSKVEQLQQLREWLVHNTHNGVITRQELVSMVPAAILQVGPNHSVLDLCAAPGSKTTQLLELIHQKEPSAHACVVANDCDAVRAYTLSARCAALGALCSRLVVAVHPAQRFPNVSIPTGPSGGGVPLEGRYPAGCFDRVLCDVPCSGDGTLRKNPEVWKRWGPGLGIRHHCIQVQIALRGAALLKTGGLMTYSTCSLSPLENEAAIAELLRRAGGALELVDASRALSGLRSSPGLHTWHVCDDGMTQWFPTYQASQGSGVPRLVRHAFRASMWPPSAKEAKRMKLERCIRILPHHQDCGGFFVALLRKVEPLPGPTPQLARAPAPINEDGDEAVAERPLYRHLQLSRVQQGVLQDIRRTFGLRATFETALGRQLWARSRSPCRVWMIPAGVSDALCGRVNAVSAGVLALVRRRGRPWEATAHGAALLLPYASGKRARALDATAADLESLRAAAGRPVPVAALSGEANASAGGGAEPGPCLLVVRDGGGGKTAAAAVLLQLEGGQPGLLVRRGCRQRYQSVLTARGE